MSDSSLLFAFLAAALVGGRAMWILRRRRRLQRLRAYQQLFDKIWQPGDTIIQQFTPPGRPITFREFTFIGRRAEQVLLLDEESQTRQRFGLEEAADLVNLRLRRNRQRQVDRENADAQHEVLTHAFGHWKARHFPQARSAARQTSGKRQGASDQ